MFNYIDPFNWFDFNKSTHLGKKKFSNNIIFKNKHNDNNVSNIIEYINSEYKLHKIKIYKQAIYEKSLILKHKLQSQNYFLTNSDLRIFKIIFEDNKHILLKHIDYDNNYQVKVSIIKLNPKLRGNFLVYFLTFSEISLNYKNEVLENIKFKHSWLHNIESGFIGNGEHPLELFIDQNFLDINSYLSITQILTFKLLLIDTEAILS